METNTTSIRNRVGVNAPIEAVYNAIATTAGAAEWWTRTVEGESTVGKTITFRFGAPDRYITAEVVELSPSDRVVWRFVDGPPEWFDTTATFELRANGDETVILFTHAGWREPVEFMHHCTTAWAYYLLSLKHGLESGTATPFPDNALISTWG